MDCFAEKKSERRSLWDVTMLLVLYRASNARPRERSFEKATLLVRLKSFEALAIHLGAETEMLRKTRP